MSDKKDNGSFQTNIELKSGLSIEGNMSSEGADNAGMTKAQGMNTFLRFAGIALIVLAIGGALAGVLYGASRFVASLAPNGFFMQPTAPSSYSPANSHTNSVK